MERCRRPSNRMIVFIVAGGLCVYVTYLLVTVLPYYPVFSHSSSYLTHRETNGQDERLRMMLSNKHVELTKLL